MYIFLATEALWITYYLPLKILKIDNNSEQKIVRFFISKLNSIYSVFTWGSVNILPFSWTVRIVNTSFNVLVRHAMLCSIVQPTIVPSPCINACNDCRRQGMTHCWRPRVRNRKCHRSQNDAMNHKNGFYWLRCEKPQTNRLPFHHDYQEQWPRFPLSCTTDEGAAIIISWLWLFMETHAAFTLLIYALTGLGHTNYAHAELYTILQFTTAFRNLLV